MKKIANIFTTAKRANYSEIFNVVNSYDNIIADLPTLIIGWDNAKNHIENINILKKEYNNIYWTFSKTERRCDYEEDIISFYESSIIKAMSNIKYIYVDILNYSINSIKKVIKFLTGNDKKTIFLTKDGKFMFVFSQKYSTVFGISLTLCEFIGVKKKKIINLVHNSEFIHDTSFIDSDIRRVIGNNTHYILPLYEYFR